LLRAQRQVLRPHGRSGRGARGVRGSLHARADAASAVPGHVPEWTNAGALDRLGCAAEGAGRAALVSPPSERAGYTRGRASLDAAQPELELDVRRLPLDESAAQLRRV